MKKLLMAMAILAVGATAFGAVQGEGKEPVKVKAELVDEKLEISDIDGRPILLDFGKISKSRTTEALATVEFKVTSTGAVTADTLKLELGGVSSTANTANVEITHINPTITDNSMTAKLGLDKYEAQVQKTDNADTIHTGRINGVLEATEWDGKEIGVYEGQTELKATLGAN